MNILVTNDDEVTAPGVLTLDQAIISLGNIKSWPQTLLFREPARISMHYHRICFENTITA
jgi:hypothetical protein